MDEAQSASKQQVCLPSFLRALKNEQPQLGSADRGVPRRAAQQNSIQSLVLLAATAERAEFASAAAACAPRKTEEEETECNRDATQVSRLERRSANEMAVCPLLAARTGGQSAASAPEDQAARPWPPGSARCAHSLPPFWRAPLLLRNRRSAAETDLLLESATCVPTKRARQPIVSLANCVSGAIAAISPPPPRCLILCSALVPLPVGQAREHIPGGRK